MSLHSSLDVLYFEWARQKDAVPWQTNQVLQAQFGSSLTIDNPTLYLGRKKGKKKRQEKCLQLRVVMEESSGWEAL